MNLKSRLVAVGAFVLLAACQPRIDGSSPEAFQTSVKKVLESVPQEERRALANDINTLANVGTAQFMGAINKDAGAAMMGEAGKVLDGLKVEEIRARAQLARIEAAAKEKAAKIKLWQGGITSAEAKIAELRKKEAEMNAFKVSLVRFSPDSPDSSAFAEVEINNGLDLEVRNVFWQISLNRNGQVSDTDFSADLPQPIPAGATARHVIRFERGALTPQNGHKIVAMTPQSVAGVTAQGSQASRGGRFGAEIAVAQAELDRFKKILDSEQAK